MDYTNHTPFWKDNVQGTRDDDRISTGWDNDIVNGSGGDDFIDGGQGRDSLFGGDDNDTIFGGNNEDFISGGEGNDRLDGGLFGDEIRGDRGNDTLIGGDGSDEMFGGIGNDTFQQEAFSFADFIDGGADIDTVDYATLNSVAPYTGEVRVSVVLSDEGNGTGTWQAMQYQSNWPFAGSEAIGFGPSTTDTLRSIENVRTGQEDDRLTGNASANRLDSGAGNDVLTGRGGADVLISGAGNDTYVYERVSDSSTSGGDFSTADLISGFGDRAGNQDLIDVSAIDANTSLLRFGNQAFTFDDGDGVREIGELHVFQIVDPNQNDRAVTVVAADTNGQGGYDFAIRFDQAIATLDRGDFIL